MTSPANPTIPAAREAPAPIVTGDPAPRFPRNPPTSQREGPPRGSPASTRLPTRRAKRGFLWGQARVGINALTPAGGGRWATGMGRGNPLVWLLRTLVLLAVISGRSAVECPDCGPKCFTTKVQPWNDASVEDAPEWGEQLCWTAVKVSSGRRNSPVQCSARTLCQPFFKYSRAGT